ncbi:MAG: hypothetical protein JOY90_22555 [Bradyrhizobium sp.]|nr:hypothetical protein [Bradyrhizobium sp.]
MAVGVIAPAMLAGTPVRAADEVFAATKAISAPAGKITSFDISFVDPALGLYFLGDRTQVAVDVINTDSNTFLKQLGKGVFTGPGPCPPIKQPAGANDCAGPDGVVAIEHREVWAGDGDSTVKVFDLEGPGSTPIHTISTGGVHRADELCFDPKHHLVLVANNAEAPFPFATLISTETYMALKRITFDGNNGTPKATNGAEQCQYDRRTDRFYLSIPEINGPGNNSAAGGVAVIDHTGQVETTFVIPVAQCSGPQGMTIGPDHQILLGCNGAVNANASTVVIDDRNGHVLAALNNESGADEVWYNPGDGHYFLARSSAVGTSQFLGVVDAERLKEDASVATTGEGTGIGNAHSVAADPVRNQVYVPIPSTATGGLCSAAGGNSANGCIAVFTTPKDDHMCEARRSLLFRVSDGGEADFSRRSCRDH